MAYLGALLPGLPTTPWVLLASYCFGKSSPRLQRWLKRSPFFGKLIRDWEEHGGIRRNVKILAVCMVCVACTFSASRTSLPDWVRIMIPCLGLVGISTILFVVPTVRDKS
ncbi:hypothetical protein FRUB_07142 [Fimbriiglobus ruber]|uniref:Inner membrane protein n=2 Tax=Fimbriiglobus ruber TaxID=1908690 RepID=A0A225D986_9BACT|nr:hypothetical protein FRUB_07142 [Fimbriiglobus ruber]